MGNKLSSCFINYAPQQITYKICLQCDLLNKFNQNFMVLNTYHCKNECHIYFRCCEGHKFWYCCNCEDYNSIIEYTRVNTNMESFISKNLNKLHETIPLAST